MNTLDKLESVATDVTLLARDKCDLEKQLADKIKALADSQAQARSLGYTMNEQAAEIRALKTSDNGERALLVYLSGRIENTPLRAGSDGRPVRDWWVDELHGPRAVRIERRADFFSPGFVEHTRRRFMWLRQVGKLHLYEEV